MQKTVEQSQTENGEYLNARQGAAHVTISPRHFARLKARGAFPAIRLSPHCVRFRRSDLDRWMSKMTVRK